MLKYFCGAPLKIYLHKYLTHGYFHTRKCPNLWYLSVKIYHIAGKFGNRKFGELIDQPIDYQLEVLSWMILVW